ncbi:RNA-directed DNA polymerase, eukaryota [Tanacetum coccineum]
MFERHRGYTSNEDLTKKISHSIFVTNFPDSVTSRDLWRECNAYGTVVDVYIYRSRNPKQVRFERPKKDAFPVKSHLNTELHNSQVGTTSNRNNHVGGSYAHVVNEGVAGDTQSHLSPNTPALVIDENCVIERDFSNCVMGKVVDANSILNIQNVLLDEGFVDVKPMYLENIQEVIPDFVSEERIAWIDIEGVPLNAWSAETFSRIRKKWGECLNIEDTSVASFAKELFTWSPNVSASKESPCNSDDESVQSKMSFPNHVQHSDEEEAEEGEFRDSDVEGVAETYWRKVFLCLRIARFVPLKQHSEDPFQIYDLLNKNKATVEPLSSSHSCSHPPGFTPVDHENKVGNSQQVGEEPVDHENKVGISQQVEKLSQEQVHHQVHSKTNGQVGKRMESKGGSVLGVLEDVIRVGRAMGFSMEGCEKDIQNIIGKQGDEPMLIISIYAPQQPSLKKALWEYLLILLGRWNGDVVIMGDFNEVRCKEERRGSVFNKYGARLFNQFINNYGLSDVKLEGFSFTWSHPSASKMSKIDRFLVSDGIISLFPDITALCLDRHLSDHRPILLRDIQMDFGPIPFRFYHSWFKYDGFDEMEKRAAISNERHGIESELHDIDKKLDSGSVSDKYLARRLELKNQLHAIKERDHADYAQKSKVRWAIEGDEKHVLTQDQVMDMEREVSREEIRSAVWNCGDNKSPGPDGYTFEFFKKYWRFIGSDFCEAVEHFFKFEAFAKGCNSSFITLIPKKMDAKFVTDFRPISLIGCVYKVVTKILANRLAMVISSIVSNTQSAFLSERQILDGPFIINEVLSWCKRKNKKAMFFKVDFAKAYDSVKWDYLINVLEAFGFGTKWCSWIRGICCNTKASILVNGSPSKEFQFHCGLKQGDPIAPLLFILVMESLHLSFRLKINIDKSQLLGVGVSRAEVAEAAGSIGCSIMDNQFRYLGVMVGGNSARHNFWADVVLKIKSRLSKWKTKTLSFSRRLREMDIIVIKFFIGADTVEKKITWVAWDKVLASKNNGGLGVSSYFALNRALMLKWIWRFVSREESMWFHVMQAIYGSNIHAHAVNVSSNWCSILREVHSLKDKGFDFLSLCSKRVGNGINSLFWLDIWTGNITLRDKFPRLFELELDKSISVSMKMAAQLDSSFRRPVRGGVESIQFIALQALIDSVVLSNEPDRWVCNVSEDGNFRVKDIRNSIDDLLLPSSPDSTKWVKFVPIKINIFGWRARRNCLPSRINLIRRGVHMESRLVQWWEQDFEPWSSFSSWDEWFSSIRLPVNNKKILEGVFYVAWWSIWVFRNRMLFDDKAPARSKIVDDIMSNSS